MLLQVDAIGIASGLLLPLATPPQISKTSLRRINLKRTLETHFQ